MTTIHIEINCGVDTCASAPGEFCEYLGYGGFDMRPVCSLFPDDYGNWSTALCEKDGEIQRCEACTQCDLTPKKADRKRCCVCGTTANVRFVGGSTPYLCDNPDCVPY